MCVWWFYNGEACFILFLVYLLSLKDGDGFWDGSRQIRIGISKQSIGPIMALESHVQARKVGALEQVFR